MILSKPSCQKSQHMALETLKTTDQELKYYVLDECPRKWERTLIHGTRVGLEPHRNHLILLA